MARVSSFIRRVTLTVEAPNRAPYARFGCARTRRVGRSSVEKGVVVDVRLVVRT